MSKELFKVTRVFLVVAILALFALTALSWGLSYLHTGHWEVPIAMGIAAAKVTIVGLVFMDLAEVRGTLRLVALTAPLFFLILISLVLGDVMLR
jgi:cytochrome c oxidase subunit IV